MENIRPVYFAPPPENPSPRTAADLWANHTAFAQLNPAEHPPTAYVALPLTAFDTIDQDRDTIYILQVGAPVRPTRNLEIPYLRQPTISVHALPGDVYREGLTAQVPSGSLLNDNNRIICVIENTADCEPRYQYYPRSVASIYPLYLPQFFEPLPIPHLSLDFDLGLIPFLHLPRSLAETDVHTRHLKICFSCDCQPTFDTITIDVLE